MKLLLALWLSTSTPAVDLEIGPVHIEGLPDEFQLVPPVPMWPDGLPLAEARPGGTWLPAPLDATVFRRLLYLDKYPELARVALDTQAYVLKTHFEEQRTTDALKADVERARAVRAAEIPPPPAAPDWKLSEVLGVGGAALGIGVVLGFVLGHH